MPEATKMTQEEVSTGSQDEEVLATHEEMHTEQVDALTENVVPEKKRDPSRFYLWHVGGVREGYWDEFPKEEKASLEANNPELYEAITLSAKEFQKAQAKEGKKSAAASDTPTETKKNGASEENKSSEE